MKRSEMIKKMRLILNKRRESLCRSIGQELTADNLQETGDEDDAAQEASAREIALKLAQGANRELAQIEKALTRMQEDRYGICEACDEPIATDRLVAVPYATLCIKCQHLSETTRNFSHTDATDSLSTTKRTGKRDDPLSETLD